MYRGAQTEPRESPLALRDLKIGPAFLAAVRILAAVNRQRTEASAVPSRFEGTGRYKWSTQKDNLPLARTRPLGHAVGTDDPIKAQPADAAFTAGRQFQRHFVYASKYRMILISGNRPTG
jgi:hypothetical protein